MHKITEQDCTQLIIPAGAILHAVEAWQLRNRIHTRVCVCVCTHMSPDHPRVETRANRQESSPKEKQRKGVPNRGVCRWKSVDVCAKVQRHENDNYRVMSQAQ